MISVVSASRDASLSRLGASAAQRDLRSHSQIGPSELIALTCFGGEEKRAGMINLYLKIKVARVMPHGDNGHWSASTLSRGLP